jgi:hypothetical protein
VSQLLRDQEEHANAVLARSDDEAKFEEAAIGKSSNLLQEQAKDPLELSNLQHYI